MKKKNRAENIKHFHLLWAVVHKEKQPFLCCFVPSASFQEVTSTVMGGGGGIRQRNPGEKEHPGVRKSIPPSGAESRVRVEGRGADLRAGPGTGEPVFLVPPPPARLCTGSCAAVGTGPPVPRHQNRGMSTPCGAGMMVSKSRDSLQSPC